MKRTPGAPALAFAGWMTQASGDKIAATRRQERRRDARRWRTRADLRRFRCRCDFAGACQAKIREIETRNVVAKIEGSDPVLKNEAVVFSAHWDHLGIGEAVNGDSIYNGAADNATGCAMILEIARAWARCRRSLGGRRFSWR